MVTMRDVAKRAGVSAATVSLSLNNSPLIPLATRQRVTAVAEKLAYKKHPYVAAHMRTRRRPGSAGSRPMLAVLDTQLARFGWRDNESAVVRQMLEGAKARAIERGYETREFWLREPGLSNERLSDVLHTRGMRGVLLGPSSSLDLELTFKWKNFSIVRLGSGRVAPPLHRVVNDHHQSIVLAVEECHRLGYRRPGLVVKEPLSACHDRRWEAGFQIACHYLAGMKPVPALLPAAKLARGELEAWFTRHRPDVIIDAAERDVLAHLSQLRLDVPRDVGVVTLCSPELGSGLTGTVQNGRNMGLSALDMLISLIERNECGLPMTPMTQSTPSIWNAGRTVARR